MRMMRHDSAQNSVAIYDFSLMGNGQGDFVVNSGDARDIDGDNEDA